MSLSCKIASLIAVAGVLLATASCSKESKPAGGSSGSGGGTQQAAFPVPPAGVHPRLFITKDLVPELKQRMAMSQGKAIISKLESLSVPRTAAEEAAVTDHGYRYYFEMRGLTSKVQLQALDYLVNGNVQSARSAVTSMLDSLKHTSFGTANDLSRASGVMIMVGALVYDWCYDQITVIERGEFVSEFLRIAKTMECGYPPKRTEAIAGHLSEWMILRDLLSCGVAIYDEYPQVYQKVAQMLQEDYIPAREYLYRGAAYHQGISYFNVRFSNDLFAQWILMRMGAGQVFSDAQHKVMYEMLYRRRPDGQMMPAGDCNPMASRKTKLGYGLPGMLAGSLWKDPYLLYEYDRKPSSLDNHCLIHELLWHDWSVGTKDPGDLPLVHYAGSPYGLMIARTGWDASSVICEMKVNEQMVGNHQHLDGGSFQLYYKGPLAIDSGAYDGSSGGYNSPHDKNYFKRTIAHNSLLIYNPSEVFGAKNYGGSDKTSTVVNDGGQRTPGESWNTCPSLAALKTDAFTYGKVLSQYSDSDWAYLKGDLTPAYSSEKAVDVRRSFLFCNLHRAGVPAALVLCDHVDSRRADYKKYFLLHSIEEPSISGNTFSVSRTLNGDSGKLVCTTLLPENAQISKVGGAGKEFTVFGMNYPQDRSDEANERGAWRVEVCPSVSNTEDSFLNVIMVGDRTSDLFGSATYISSEKLVGTVFADRVAAFCADGTTLPSEFGFRFAGNGNFSIFVADVADGMWDIATPQGSTHSQKAENGLLILNGTSGGYTFKKQ